MVAGQDSQALLTLSASVSAGVLLVAVSRQMNLSAIVLLLAGGVLLGPRGVGLVHPDSLGDVLRPLVSLSVGLILFEGGLSLDLQGYRSASRVIIRLLTVGVLVTWLCTALAIRLLFGFDLSFSLLAGSLVIVTGPTVIVPLLKRIKVRQPLHSILHWEGVLIDPIGVFVAILCFEWVGGRGHSALGYFLMRVVAGGFLGLAGGAAMAWLIRRRMVQEELIAIVPLALAVLVFIISETLASQSGLLATTTAGFVLGASRPTELRQIRLFKAAVTDLLIGALFVALAARLGPEQFAAFGPRGAILVAVVMLLVRPLNILACTLGEPLDWRHRAFLAWIAPRGIVAASMSSVFALALAGRGVAGAAFLETFTYSVIVSTVLLQGLTAGRLATALDLSRPAATGWLIVGAHRFGQCVAAFITESAGLQAVLADTNPRAVREAREAGRTALAVDARDVEAVEDRPELQGVGHLLALTDNEDLNSLLCRRWAETLGRYRVFGWHSAVRSADSDPEAAASMIWQHLPRPSVLSTDLAQQRATLNAIEVGGSGALPRGTLALAGRGRVGLAPPAGRPASAATPRALVLERRGSYLIEALRPELFLCPDTCDLAELFAGMVHRLVSAVPQLPAADLLRELLEREKVFSSAIGSGVAIPHVYHRAVPARLCALARVRQALNVTGMDGQPVRLVFLLVGPPGDPQGHLALIAEIARVVSHDRTRARLMEAASFEAVLGAIRAAPPGA